MAAGSAFGATRYAPAGIADCSSPGNACGIVTAVGGAGNGDQVVVEHGTYNVSVPITSSATDLDVIGVGTIPGSFTPEVIDTTATPGVQITGSGSTLTDLDIEDTGSSSTGAALVFTGALAERLLVRAGPNEQFGCALGLDAVLLDTLCQQQGTGVGLEVSDLLGSSTRRASLAARRSPTTGRASSALVTRPFPSCSWTRPRATSAPPSARRRSTRASPTPPMGLRTSTMIRGRSTRAARARVQTSGRASTTRRSVR